MQKFSSYNKKSSPKSLQESEHLGIALKVFRSNTYLRIKQQRRKEIHYQTLFKLQIILHDNFKNKKQFSHGSQNGVKHNGRKK